MIAALPEKSGAPIAQASFFFTVQTLARSGRHRLYVAAYLAVGALLAYFQVAPLLARGPASLAGAPSVKSTAGMAFTAAVTALTNRDGGPGGHPTRVVTAERTGTAGADAVSNETGAGCSKLVA